MCEYIGIGFPIGGSGGGTPTAAGVRAHHFTLKSAVKGAGAEYLFVGDVSTLEAPHVVLTPGTMSGASISVDKADAGSDYDIEILKNGIVVETFTLISTNTKASIKTLTTAVVDLDEVVIRVIRSSGTGNSDFKRAIVTLHITDT